MNLDPKDKEVRREVGWRGPWFVELSVRPNEDFRSQMKFEVNVLVNGDQTFWTPAQDLLEAQMIFDTLEQKLRSPEQGVFEYVPQRVDEWGKNNPTRSSRMNENTEYMTDAMGRRVPVAMIKPVDKLRDSTVQEVVRAALALRQAVIEFKTTVMAELTAFLDLSANEHGKVWGGEKGNVQLLSYDGRYKVRIAQDDIIVHNEKLQVAKGIIDECVRRWADGARPEILTLITDAFYVGKSGRINTYRILGLRRCPSATRNGRRPWT